MRCSPGVFWNFFAEKDTQADLVEEIGGGSGSVGGLSIGLSLVHVVSERCCD